MGIFVLNFGLRALASTVALAYISYAASPQLQIRASSPEMAIDGTVFSAVERSKGGYFIVVRDLKAPNKECSLQIFDSKGNRLRKILANEYGGPPFSNVFKLRADPRTGNVWLADQGQARILVFDEDGNFKASTPIQRPNHGVDDYAFAKDSSAIFTTGCVVKGSYAKAGCSSRLQQYDRAITSPSKVYFADFENTEALAQSHYQLSLSSIALDNADRIAFGDTPDRTVSILNLKSGMVKKFSLADKIPPIPNLAELPGGPFQFTMNHPTLGDIESSDQGFVVGLRQFNGGTPDVGLFSMNLSKVVWFVRPPGSLVGHDRQGRLLFLLKVGENRAKFLSAIVIE